MGRRIRLFSFVSFLVFGTIWGLHTPPIATPQSGVETPYEMAVSKDVMVTMRDGVRLATDYEAWLAEAMSHGDYDDFWKNMGASVVDHLAEYKDIPVYLVGGWYDSWGAQTANLNYIQLSTTQHN